MWSATVSIRGSEAILTIFLKIIWFHHNHKVYEFIPGRTLSQCISVRLWQNSSSSLACSFSFKYDCETSYRRNLEVNWCLHFFYSTPICYVSLLVSSCTFPCIKNTLKIFKLLITFMIVRICFISANYGTVGLYNIFQYILQDSLLICGELWVSSQEKLKSHDN